jgi:hypothetical protein
MIIFNGLLIKPRRDHWNIVCMSALPSSIIRETGSWSSPKPRGLNFAWHLSIFLKHFFNLFVIVKTFSDYNLKKL